MTLTAQQDADVRRFAGYPALGTDTPADDSRDFAYGWVSPGVWQTLEHRLANLTPENEATLVSIYLTNLYTLEQQIISAAANLDTAQAAVWKRNPTEITDRAKLFDGWRRRMCGFLGIAPGPALHTRGLSLARG
ncbi:MAG: hypothetical protein ACRES6_08940 [Steroidobacteraceae bacterium]